MTAIIAAIICISAPLFMITTVISTVFYLNKRKQFVSFQASNEAHVEQYRQQLADEIMRLITEHQERIASEEQMQQHLRQQLAEELALREQMQQQFQQQLADEIAAKGQMQQQLCRQLADETAKLLSQHQEELAAKEQMQHQFRQQLAEELVVKEHQFRQQLAEELAAEKQVQHQLRQQLASETARLMSQYQEELTAKEQMQQRLQAQMVQALSQLEQRFRDEAARLEAQHQAKLATEAQAQQQLQGEITHAKHQLVQRDNRIMRLSQDAVVDQRDTWSRSLARVSYRNETEVEIKFVHSLLQFLGYLDTDTQIRVSITVQVGRQPVNGQADWVIKRSNGDRVVIEAKEPNQPLDEHVQAQAQSYAFALRATSYVLTNGATIQIFRRGIHEDERVLHCDVKHLASYWKVIESTIGKTIS